MVMLQISHTPQMSVSTKRPKESTPSIVRQHANVPSNEKRRVRHACVTCRGKKIKCDGEDPCQRCQQLGSPCEYLETEQSMQLSTGGASKSLENRVASMEQRLESTMNSIEKLLQMISKQIHDKPTTELGGEALAKRSESLLVGSNDDTSISEFANQKVPLSPLFSITDNQQLLSPPTSYAGTTRTLHKRLNRPKRDSIDHLSLEFAEGGIAQDVFPFADEHGELLSDIKGHRYIGLGSTAFVIDRCNRLSRHVNKSPKTKGYEVESDEFLTDPTLDYMGSPGRSDPYEWELLPRDLVSLLFQAYAESLHVVYPVILVTELWMMYEMLVGSRTSHTGDVAIVFAALAVSIPLARAKLASLERQGIKYPDKYTGRHFFNQSIRFVSCGSPSASCRRTSIKDNVIAYALLSIYLAETGSQVEAWALVGRAIRAGQDIGLHRSPRKLGLPPPERKKRNLIWWSLYVLERQLSFALGRPLMINDDDCDVEPPEELEGWWSNESDTTNFGTFVELYKILGHIHKTVKTVKTVKSADDWHESANFEQLRGKVQNLALSLHAWSDRATESTQRPIGCKVSMAAQLCLSSYHLAVVELYRPFLPRPHQKGQMSSDDAQSRCVKAAADYILGSKMFLEAVPAGHYHVLHGQSLLICAMILLQCSRFSEDQVLFNNSLENTRLALIGLEQLEVSWKSAKKVQRIIEDYRQLTIRVHQGYFERGEWNFMHINEKNGAPSRRLSETLKRKTSPTSGIHANRLESSRREKRPMHGQPATPENWNAGSVVQSESSKSSCDWDYRGTNTVKVSGEADLHGERTHQISQFHSGTDVEDRVPGIDNEQGFDYGIEAFLNTSSQVTPFECEFGLRADFDYPDVSMMAGQVWAPGYRSTCRLETLPQSPVGARETRELLSSVVRC